MNKIFLGALALTFCSGVAMAQETDTLFPELKGQFEQIAPSQTETIDLTVEQIDPASQSNQPSVQPNTQEKKSTTEGEKQTPEDEKGEGKIIIQIENVEGVLPYARTLSYCSAEAVLTNETNQRLDELSLTITYKDMPKDLSYGGVPKKRTRTQKFMLIGLPCESIKSMPQVDIKTCKLKNLSEEACKKRVQFLPPGG